VPITSGSSLAPRLHQPGAIQAPTAGMLETMLLVGQGGALDTPVVPPGVLQERNVIGREFPPV